jgi:hypothetical protein
MNTFSRTYRPVLNSDMFEDDLLYYDPVLDFVKYKVLGLYVKQKEGGYSGTMRLFHRQQNS